MSDILEEIRSRGHWKVVVHPARFDEGRVPIKSALLPILERSKVRLWGWSFPFLDDYMEESEGPDWIGREVKYDPLIELWRFYQSGQFLHYSGMTTDWSKHVGTFSGWPSQWHEGKTRELKVLLDIKEVIIRFAEILEFAARLSSTQAGDDQMHLEIEVVGIENHLLRVSQSKELDRFREMTNPSHKIPFEFDLPLLELKANTRELALKPAAELFSYFGWNPGGAILRDIQAEVLTPALPRAGWV
ncbi:MAG: hypothetical protein OXI91_07830 [Chloroflexota bacterium]|nr:hypothetical protein [Chloroflexota bacterium]